MRPQVVTVKVGSRSSCQSGAKKVDSKSNTISTEIKPFFSDKSRYLFLAAGCDINIYNTSGGNLIDTLEKHKRKIIGICCKKNDADRQIIFSCDDECTLYQWEIGSNNVPKPVYLRIPAKQRQKNTKAAYFGLGNNLSYLVGFYDPESSDVHLYKYSRPYKFSDFITNGIPKGCNTIATSGDGQFIALIKDGGRLFVTKYPYIPDKKSTRIHQTGKKLSCLAFHPVDVILAVGDTTGAITLWYNILQHYPVKTILHWHTLPVQDLAFSSDGSELYSGGGEAVIVCWHLVENNKKSFLPRLGMPIRYISTDDINCYVAALHADKTISIINSREMTLEGLIQDLALHMPVGNGQPLPVGLLLHSKSYALVMNGRTGHLQFFNPYSSTILYSLDITLSNFASRERDEELPNAEVTVGSISDDSMWLATVETCQLSKDMNEVYLKFWYYSVEDRRWQLNTNIQMPQSENITALCFQSARDSSDSAACVSCSEDGKFKLWKLVEYLDVHGKQKSHWNSQATREFRGYPASTAAFSPDGSVIAVAFQSVITLWTPDGDCQLMGSLSQPFLAESIRDVTFNYGEREGSHIISRTDNWLCSWDLLSCSLKWRVSMASTCLAVEKSTGVMAIFSKSKEIIFFESYSSEPLMHLKTLGSADVLSAVFVPSAEKFAFDADVPWKSNRSLYFVDSDQVLYTVRDADELDPHLSKSLKKTLNQLTSDQHTVHRNLYSALTAKTRHITQRHQNVDVTSVRTTDAARSLLEYLNQVSVHNMESMSDLMGFLRLLAPDVKKTELEAKKNKALQYTTIKDDYEVSTDVPAEDPAVLANIVDSIQNIDYDSIVKVIKS